MRKSISDCKDNEMKDTKLKHAQSGVLRYNNLQFHVSVEMYSNLSFVWAFITSLFELSSNIIQYIFHFSLRQVWLHITVHMDVAAKKKSQVCIEELLILGNNGKTFWTRNGLVQYIAPHYLKILFK